MAENELKISEMLAATTLNDNDILPIVQNNTNKTISVELLKALLSNNKTVKSHLKILNDINAGATIIIPIKYKVGIDCLDVFLNGEYLTKCTTYDDENTGTYSEVGTANSISNQIKITTAYSLESGDYFDFIVRGVYE